MKEIIKRELLNKCRQLERTYSKLENLQNTDNLSKHGFQSIGYYTGIISEREDFIEFLNELLEVVE